MRTKETDGEKASVATKYLREMINFILKVNSFQFCGNNYIQTNTTAMGRKMAIAFVNIFVVKD